MNPAFKSYHMCSLVRSTLHSNFWYILLFLIFWDILYICPVKPVKGTGHMIVLRVFVIYHHFYHSQLYSVPSPPIQKDQKQREKCQNANLYFRPGIAWSLQHLPLAFGARTTDIGIRQLGSQARRHIRHYGNFICIALPHFLSGYLSTRN